MTSTKASNWQQRWGVEGGFGAEFALKLLVSCHRGIGPQAAKYGSTLSLAPNLWAV